jgi:hypothetical protein
VAAGVNKYFNLNQHKIFFMATKTKKRSTHHKKGGHSRKVGAVNYRPPATVGKVHRKRRSVSGVGKGMKGVFHNLTILAGNTAGMALGAVIMPKLPINAGAQSIAGIGLSLVGMHMSKPGGFMHAVATGVGSGSMMNVAHKAGVLHGLEDTINGLMPSATLAPYEHEVRSIGEADGIQGNIPAAQPAMQSYAPDLTQYTGSEHW